MVREDIRDTLSEIQLIVYSQDCEQTTYLDPATGMPPFIATTDGVFHYECPANCRRTAVVFAEGLPIQFNRTRPVGPQKTYYFRNKGYHTVDVISRDALENHLATLDFQGNPGTTTNQFYHLYYLKPAAITDEETQSLLIPEHLHWLLRKAVIAMYTSEEYGDTDREEVAMERIARKIRNALNAGTQTRVGVTPWQEQDQDIPNTGFYGYRI
jgi:hypothetical protein